MKNKVLIITPGGLPVPSVEGGAVQNLIELLIKQNELKNRIDLVILSPYSEDAYLFASHNYKFCKFLWVKTPKYIQLLDKITYYIAEKILKVKRSISFRNNFKSLNYVLKISKILKNNDYDKVIFENNIRNFYALKLKGNFKKYLGKYYFHLHNVPRASLGCKKEIYNCKKILCVSEYVRKNISSSESKIGKCEYHNTELFMNCLDMINFTDQKKDKIEYYKKKFGIKDNEKVIIYAGRLDKNKGIVELLNAFKVVANQWNIKLLIVGSCFYNMKVKDHFEDKLRKMCESIKDKIVFTGYVDYDEMQYIYKLGYVSILPSTGLEAAGLTIIESLACGIPVITTNSGGIPEYSGKNSTIVLNNDENLTKNIILSLETLLRDEQKYFNMKKMSIEEVEKYNINNYYDNFISLLEDN